jgi:hypothetical protein
VQQPEQVKSYLHNSGEPQAPKETVSAKRNLLRFFRIAAGRKGITLLTLLLTKTFIQKVA